MCGIVGLVSNDSFALRPVIERMTDAVSHRGPDDRGTWLRPEGGLALGHRRLSILDLSSQGRQPMASPCARYVLVFNGEIYNHLDLRNSLEAGGHVRAGWRGHSDTETLLAAISAWGLETALARSTGMFALALWDAHERVLSLARDRMGEKPLYYLPGNAVFAFGSELKPFRTIPGLDLTVSPESVAQLLHHGYIPAPLSIYKDIRKLPPASTLSVSLRDTEFRIGTPKRYWSINPAAPTDLDDEEACARLESLLATAVRRQMISDVPLGAFLSGGIDSSLVVALMQANAARPVRTFTIGFREQSHDECAHAAAVARHLGTDHTELVVTPQDALAVIPRLPAIYDEPFADSSQIPTAILAGLTRRHVTVSLSGDGGDELFAGYPRYQFAQLLWQTIAPFPRFVRSAAAQPIGAISIKRWDALLSLLPARLRGPHVSGHRIRRLSNVLVARDFAEMYDHLSAHWVNVKDVLASGEAPLSLGVSIEPDEPLQQMRMHDLARYLPDDILVKVDRATMHAGLESRAPILDHAVVEFAFSLPARMLVRNGTGKWLLRKVLRRFLPGHLFERPKSGFSVPLGEWLRGPLKEWAEELLSVPSLKVHGLLNEHTVRETWCQHLAGHQNAEARLWDILMFQAWYFATVQPTEA